MFNETEIKQIVAISVLLAATKVTKFVFDRGSAPDPAGRAHDAPPDPIVGWGGDTPPHSPPLGASILTPSAPRFQRSATFFTVSAMCTCYYLH